MWFRMVCASVQVGWCKYLTMRPESLSRWIARLSVDERADAVQV